MEDLPDGSVTDLSSHPAVFLLQDLSDRHRELFNEGRRLFNDRAFWEAHEAWEEVWREVPSPQKQLLQGLIQAAAAYHLIVTSPRINGALGNIEKSLTKLDGMPEVCFGVRIAEVRDVLRRAHEEAKRVGQEGLSGIGDAFVPVI